MATVKTPRAAWNLLAAAVAVALVWGWTLTEAYTFYPDADDEGFRQFFMMFAQGGPYVWAVLGICSGMLFVLTWFENARRTADAEARQIEGNEQPPESYIDVVDLDDTRDAHRWR